MQLLPQDRLTVTTSLDVSTVKQRLTSLTEAQQTHPLSMYHPQQAVYRGNVVGNDVELSRSASVGQNAFAPFIRGQISDDNERTTTTFQFSPNTFTQAAFLMTIIFTIGCTILMVAALLTGGGLSGFMILPYVIAALLYAFYRSCFRAEVQKEKRFLTEIVLGKFEHDRTHQMVGKSQAPHD